MRALVATLLAALMSCNALGLPVLVVIADGIGHADLADLDGVSYPHLAGLAEHGTIFDHVYGWASPDITRWAILTGALATDAVVTTTAIPRALPLADVQEKYCSDALLILSASEPGLAGTEAALVAAVAMGCPGVFALISTGTNALGKRATAGVRLAAIVADVSGTAECVGPCIASGARSPVFLHASDFIATVLALACMPSCATAAGSLAGGVDASRWVRNEMPVGSQPPRAFIPVKQPDQSTGLGGAGIVGGFKYLDTDAIVPGSPAALYDLTTDPEERNNIISSHAAVATAIYAHLRDGCFHTAQRGAPGAERGGEEPRSEAWGESVYLIPDGMKTALPTVIAKLRTVVGLVVTVVACLFFLRCGRAYRRVTRAAAREEQHEEELRAAVHSHGGRWPREQVPAVPPK